MTESYDRYGNRGGQSQDIGSPPYYSQSFGVTTNQIRRVALDKSEGVVKGHWSWAVRKHR